MLLYVITYVVLVIIIFRFNKYPFHSCFLSILHALTAYGNFPEIISLTMMYVIFLTAAWLADILSIFFLDAELDFEADY